VSVTGDVDDNSATATASSITVHGGVRGAVTAVDTTSAIKTLTVAGQTIQVDANTVFEGLNSASLSLAGLKAAVDAANLTVTAADTVYAEVYVVGDATSGFLATRVEQKAAIAEGYAVVGKIVTGSLNATSFGLLLRNGQGCSCFTGGRGTGQGQESRQFSGQVSGQGAAVHDTQAGATGLLRP